MAKSKRVGAAFTKGITLLGNSVRVHVNRKNRSTTIAANTIHFPALNTFRGTELVEKKEGRKCFEATGRVDKCSAGVTPMARHTQVVDTALRIHELRPQTLKRWGRDRATVWSQVEGDIIIDPKCNGRQRKWDREPKEDMTSTE